MLRSALISLVLAAGTLWGAPPNNADNDKDAISSEILEKYASASRTQTEIMRGLQMDVDIDAKLPSLQKSGRAQVLRTVSKLGQITFNYFRFSGDNTVKKEVIARYLTAETQAKDLAAISLSPANYKFKFKGLQDRDGRQVYVFQVNPRKKLIGLFKGELWLDEQTCMPVHEQGRLVKNPSVFLKSIEFVRDYELRDGVSYLKHMDSTVNTRIVGKAEIHVSYSNYSKIDTEAAAVSTGNTEHR